MANTTALRSARKTSTTTDLALIATFAALIAVCSVSAALPIGLNGVPVTLQVFAVFLAGAVLGMKRGFLAVLLYLAVGAAGLPIFAGGTSGIAPFTGPSAGYLVSFPIAAALIGFLVERARHRGLAVTAAVVGVAGIIGEFVVYALGSLGLIVFAGLSKQAGFKGALAYVPADLAKVVAVAIVAAAVHRAFPALLSKRS
jgi:biotin transport system substrate-specific component